MITDADFLRSIHVQPYEIDRSVTQRALDAALACAEYHIEQADLWRRRAASAVRARDGWIVATIVAWIAAIAAWRF